MRSSVRRFSRRLVVSCRIGSFLLWRPSGGLTSTIEIRSGRTRQNIRSVDIIDRPPVCFHQNDEVLEIWRDDREDWLLSQPKIWPQAYKLVERNLGVSLDVIILHGDPADA